MVDAMPLKISGVWLPSKSYNNLNMLTHKGLLTLYAGLAELVLQHRIAPSPAASAHLLSLRTELDLARTLLRPADDIGHFLVPREQYQIRAKLASRMRSLPCPALHLTIRFLLSNKLTGAQQIPQIWRISVETGEQGAGEEGDWAHEKVHCLHQVVQHLSASHLFSEMARTRQLSRNYILDFEIDLADNRDELSCPLQQTGRMWTAQARLGEAAKLRVDCYWRQHLELSAVGRSVCLREPRRGKNKSEETCGDSFELSSSDNIRRMRSCEEPVFELYDSELECTVLSSDSDTLTHSQLVGELQLEEVDEFELLIEEDADEDELFLRDNEHLLQEWGSLLKGLN